ncbi:ML domain-containing protein [Spinellus fusiger]|nr:ML domain-containing protein [Spinellus fusiger]
MRFSSLSVAALATAATLATATHGSFLPNFFFQSEEDVFTEKTNLITNCGDSTDLLIIKDITLTPDPPVKGQLLTVDFSGFLKEPVENGTYIDVAIKYGLVQIIHKRFDFCNEVADKVDEACPIPEGPLVFHKEIELPKEIPGGRYTVNAKIVSSTEKRIACLVGKTSFPRR